MAAVNKPGRFSDALLGLDPERLAINDSALATWGADVTGVFMSRLFQRLQLHDTYLIMNFILY
ncbi:uncharacterized protein V6R79_016684 [Siganus canaliculatus]